MYAPTALPACLTHCQKPFTLPSLAKDVAYITMLTLDITAHCLCMVDLKLNYDSVKANLKSSSDTQSSTDKKIEDAVKL